MSIEEFISSESLAYGAGRGMARYPNLHPARPGIPAVPVSGAVGWWDAADISSASMTFDASGLRAATWKDKTTSGFNASANAVGIGQVGQPPALSNRLTMIHDLNSYYTTTCPADDRTQTCFFMGILRDFASVRGLLGANNTGGRLIRITTTGKIEVLSQFVSSLFTTTTLTAAAGSPFVCCVILDTNTIEVRLNRGTPESTSNSTTFTAGRTTNFGHDVSSGGPTFDGWIGEILIYGTTLSSVNTGLVMDYLMAKWGI